MRRRVKEKEPLAGHTSFRIGGPADFFARIPTEAGLKSALAACRRGGVRCRVIGAGSNILARDAGVSGAVLKLDSPFFRRISCRGTRVTAAAGANLASLVRECSCRGLSGLEFLAGIPGTVGGGLAMNCGTGAQGCRNSIGDRVALIRVIDHNGKLSTLPASAARLGYRSSGLSRYIILSAVFCLDRSTPAAVKRGVRAALEARRGQDYRFPSAGCVFRNPKSAPAGKLIDACGLKGASFGGARISQKHANFIVNAGHAGSEDVLALMDRARALVKKRFGITLRPEIKIWR